MRKIKHIWNVAFVAATGIIATTIPCLCSCKNEHSNNPTEPTVNSIDIELPTDTFYVQEYQSYVSEPIEITCFNKQGKVVEAETSAIIQSEEGGNKPDWIWIDNKNQINIMGKPSASKFTFNVYFVDDETQTIKSETKSFDVEIYKTPTVPPQSLEVVHDEDVEYLLLTEEKSIHLSLVGHHEGFQPEEVDTRARWTRGLIQGPHTSDLVGNPLFDVDYNDEGCELRVSTKINQNYIGFYTVSVMALSKASPSVTAYAQIKIEIVDGLSYTDTTSGCIFKRTGLNRCWTLTQYIYDQTEVYGMPDVIYGYPVTKVADNFCSTSGITDLETIILSNTITEIGDSAFEGLESLTSIGMPGVKYVGNNAFANCINMNISHMYDFGYPSFVYAGTRAFYNCKKLDLSTDLQNFMYIGQEAFCGSGLTAINIGDNITYFDTDVFTDCPNLQDIIISSTIPPKIGGVLFYGSTYPQSIKVPTSALNDYLASQYWQPYKDIIVGM
ncbi:MAG: leucine-rich repeat domain-containing protein [Mycoplasmoidaceae bacterium]